MGGYTEYTMTQVIPVAPDTFWVAYDVEEDVPLLEEIRFFALCTVRYYKSTTATDGEDDAPAVLPLVQDGNTARLEPLQPDFLSNVIGMFSGDNVMVQALAAQQRIREEKIQNKRSVSP